MLSQIKHPSQPTAFLREYPEESSAFKKYDGHNKQVLIYAMHGIFSFVVLCHAPPQQKNQPLNEDQFPCGWIRTVYLTPQPENQGQLPPRKKVTFGYNYERYFSPFMDSPVDLLCRIDNNHALIMQEKDKDGKCFAGLTNCFVERDLMTACMVVSCGLFDNANAVVLRVLPDVSTPGSGTVPVGHWVKPQHYNKKADFCFVQTMFCDTASQNKKDFESLKSGWVETKNLLHAPSRDDLPQPRGQSRRLKAGTTLFRHELTDPAVAFTLSQSQDVMVIDSHDDFRIWDRLLVSVVGQPHLCGWVSSPGGPGSGDAVSVFVTDGNDSDDE